MRRDVKSILLSSLLRLQFELAREVSHSEPKKKRSKVIHDDDDDEAEWNQDELAEDSEGDEGSAYEVPICILSLALKSCLVTIPPAFAS